MLEGFIEKLILSFFGDYIENLDKNKLTLGLWAGSLVLEDIMIRAKAINDLKLPFKLIFGKIGKLTLSIPWKQNFSVPTIITVDTVQVVLSLIKKEDWEFIDYNNYKAKIGYLMQFANERIYQLSQAFLSKEGMNSTTSSGYWDRVIVKVLDNLHVNFKNINIRVEDSYAVIPYSLGITLQEMFVVNTNENWEQQFIDRNVNKNINVYKLLRISNFGIYIKTNETMFIGKENVDDIYKKMIDFFPNGASKAKDMDYLIKPVSLTAKMKQHNDNITTGNKTDEGVSENGSTTPSTNTNAGSTARVNLFISLDTFDFDIQKSQFDCLIRISNNVSNYQKFQYDYNYNTTKYKYFKPKHRIMEGVKVEIVNPDPCDIDPNTEAKESETPKDIIINPYTSLTVKNPIAVQWWQYSIHMILKQIKYYKGNTKVFDISPVITDNFLNKFGSLFHKYFKNPKDGLDEAELNTFQNIVEYTELKDLYLWSKPVLQEIYTEQKKEEKKKAQTGYLTYLIGQSLNDNEIITQEEQEKIEEILANAVKEVTTLIINNEIETKFQLNFILKEGSFNFSKQFNATNAVIKEGFGIRYRSLSIAFRKGEFFNEVDADLKEFQIDMYTVINGNTIRTPITFKQMGDDYSINNPIVHVDTLKSDSNEDVVLSKTVIDLDNIEESNEDKQNYKSPKNNVSSITAIGNGNGNGTDDDYFLRIAFRKNNPNEEINSRFRLDMNVLHTTYHQVFLERIVNFFKVDLNEDLTSKAWDKITAIKENTQQTIKENMYKRNIVEINIEPRKIIIPINKYDIKNTKLLLIDLGKLSMLNDEDNDNIDKDKDKDDKYKERYNLRLGSLSLAYFPSLKEMIANTSRFDIVTDVVATFGFALLNQNYNKELHPNFMLFLEINNITFNLNSYLYSLLTYIVDILKPTKEIDLWSQLTTDKEEIKKNAKETAKIWKKSRTLLIWEEYHAVLANGYIYFYSHMEDDEYEGYYYLKDSIITPSNIEEESFEVKLSNKYGSIELKFLNEIKYDQWLKSIKERIREMKLSSDDKTTEIDIEASNMKINPKVIFFGAEITLKQITLNLYTIPTKTYMQSKSTYQIEMSGISNISEVSNRKSTNNLKQKGISTNDVCIGLTNYNKIFTMKITHLFLDIKLREYDTDIHLSIEGIKLIDNLSTITDFKQILCSEDISITNSNNKLKLFELSILICDEPSDKYNNTQIDINISIGYLYVIWNPIVIRRLLGFLVHNDILKHKIRREISIPNEKLLDSNFLAPGTEEEVLKPVCTVSKYIYIKLHSQFKTVSIVWIQPFLNIKFNEMRFGESYLNCDMKVDHFLIEGSLGNTQLFDHCQYPFVIKSQSEYDPSKVKEIFGTKANTDSLISFKYKSMSNWCPECKSNYLSEADIKINSAHLIYIHEHFMRFFDYFINEFLGALGPNEEVKQFQNQQYKIMPKGDKDIYFMKLKLNITNPQIIIKPRYNFNEFFLIDLGNVTLDCSYQKVLGKIRENPNEYRWTTTYQFDMRNVNIKTEDGFNILSPTNGIVNMHFNNYTEKDMEMNEIEYDFSYQFDLFFNALNLNLRQKDLTNMLRCLDLNILYTDERGEDYLEEKLRNKGNGNGKCNNEGEGDDSSWCSSNNNSNVSDKAKNRKQKEELMNIYYRMIVFLIIPRVSLRLYMNDEPFVEFLLQETQINYFQKLNMVKFAQILIADMEAYELDNTTNKKRKILSDFTQLIQEANYIIGKTDTSFAHDYKNDDDINENIITNNPKENDHNNSSNNKPLCSHKFCEQRFNEIQRCIIQVSRIKEATKTQADIKITIDSTREKIYNISLNGFKLLMRIDTFQLCRYFFTEAFPFYDKHLKDLPNLYDPNEENNPGMRLNIEIKKPLICFLTDSLSNRNQDLICITSEVIIAMKNNKITKVKNELFKRNKEINHFLEYITDEEQRKTLMTEMTNDKSFIWSFNLSLFEICPFICSMNEVLYTNDLKISKRKIMDNFMFTYESKTEMQFMQPSMYVLTSFELFDLNKITVKASYRDIVLYIKMFNYNYSMLNEKYYQLLEQLKMYSKAKKESEERIKMKINEEILAENIKVINEINKNDTLRDDEDHDIHNEDTIKYESDDDDDDMENIEDLENIPDEFDDNDADDKMHKINELNIKASHHSPRKRSCLKAKERRESIIKAHRDSITNYSNNLNNPQENIPKNIIEKGMGLRTILSKGFQLILIDDHANTFYPFLSLIISEFISKTEYLNHNQKIGTIKLVGKVLSYNYIAGVWEPLIEKTNILFEITSDYSNEQLQSNIYVIKTQPVKNAPDISINISDLSITFLYTTMNNWFEKYSKLMENYDSENQLVQKEKNMAITNHTVFNYSGRPMMLYRRFGAKDQPMKKSKLSLLKANDSYEIEYFAEIKENAQNVNKGDYASNLLQDNYISFAMDNVRASNHIIKIDNMQTKIHKVDYSKICKGGEKYGYIISKIEFHQLKKYIYFYSPISFKNKTKETIDLKLFNLDNDKEQAVYKLEAKKTFGVPNEYLNGFIEVSVENSKIIKQFSLSKFMTSQTIIEEIQFANDYFINVFYLKKDLVSKHKIIKFCNSYSIRNCLPFPIKLILSGTNQVFDMNKNETIVVSSLSIYSPLSVYIYFCTFRTARKVILYQPIGQQSSSSSSKDNENNKTNSKTQAPGSSTLPIEMLDDDNNPLMIYSSVIDNEDRTIVLHSTNMIINHTGLNVVFYYGEQRKRRVTNQKNNNNFFLLDEESVIVIEYRDYSSQPVSIKAVGTSSIVRLENIKGQVIEFIMENALSLLGLDLDLYTNIITLVPRYILYNQLECAVEIVLRTILTKTLLGPNKRAPLYYISSQEGKNELIYLSPIELSYIDDQPHNNNNDNNALWDLSTPIHISSGALTTLVVYSMDKRRKRYINVEKKLDELSTYIMFKPSDYNTSQIVIENHSSNVSLKLWQENYDTRTEYINIKTKSIIAWSNIASFLILNIHFYIGDLRKCPLIYQSPTTMKKYELLDDKVISYENDFQNCQNYPYAETIKISHSNYTGFGFKIEIKSDGCRIEIHIDDIIQPIRNVIAPKQKIVNEYSFYINKLGLSIIGDNQNLRSKKEVDTYARFEICYMYFDNIVFYFKQEIIEKNYQTELQVMIRDMEIDNQYDYFKTFPIICLPENSSRRTKEMESEYNHNHNHLTPFFNCTISMENRSDEDMTRILLFNYLIQAFELNIESNVLVAFLNLMKNMIKGMETSLTKINPLFLNEKMQKDKMIYIKDWYYQPIWKEKIIMNEQQKLFISQLEASSLEITFTFISQTKDKVFQQLLQNNRFLSTSSLLNAVSNIEKSPLLLNGCQMYNFKGNWMVLIWNILYAYQQNILVQMMRLFGSIDILGNPLNLMNSLGKGFKDLFQKPAQGILKGPLQGAIGLFDGGLSLAKHTVDGTFNTTSKITSGLSKGMLLLTQDDEYINDRERKKITEKPKNFIEGIGYGLSSVAGGIFHGMTDIFKKPIEGAQQDNIKGFGKGLLKGLGGAIFKPISGVFDLVSKTTEGIKNTVASEEVLKALRLPRPFYGKYKLFKSYSQCDAQVIELLSTRIDQLKNKHIDFYSCEIYKNQKDDSILLAFLTDGLFLIDILRRELKTSLDYEVIKEVRLEDQSKVKLFFTIEINHRMSTSITVNKSSNAKKIYDKIQDAIENNCEGKSTYKR